MIRSTKAPALVTRAYVSVAIIDIGIGRTDAVTKLVYFILSDVHGITDEAIDVGHSVRVR